MKRKEKCMMQDKQKNFFCMLGIFLVVALPLFTNYCLNSSEVPYQLVRIEELTNHLHAGIFQIAMPVNWQYEHGTAGLDGNLFWVLPAILRKIGFPLERAYRIFLMCICAASVGLSYTAFRKLFQNNKLGMMGCMLYNWTPWYVDALYGRAAIGEALGYACLPVLLLFLADVPKQGAEKELKWPVLTVGLTLLLQSSLAVFLIGMFLLVFICIYERRQMLCKKGLLTLCKAAGATLLLNLWYLLPLAKYLVAYRDVAKLVGSRPFQEKGAYLMHYLMVFFQPGAAYDYKEKGFFHSAAVGIGPALMALLFLFLWLEFSGQLRLKKQKAEMTKGMFFFGILGVVLSLGSFPWDLLRENAVFQVLTFSMQSPMIFMIPAVCGFVMLGCSLMRFYEQERSAKAALILELCVIAVAFVGTQYLVNGLILDRAPLWIRESEDLPDVVLNEAVQLQLSQTSGKAAWAAVIVSVCTMFGILGYCVMTRRKNRETDVRKEAA